MSRERIKEQVSAGYPNSRQNRQFPSLREIHSVDINSVGYEVRNSDHSQLRREDRGFVYRFADNRVRYEKNHGASFECGSTDMARGMMDNPYYGTDERRYTMERDYMNEEDVRRGCYERGEEIGSNEIAEESDEERYEECGGLTYLVSMRNSPSELLHLLINPIDARIINHGLPKRPPALTVGRAYSFLISSTSIPHSDYSTDDFSPWTSSENKAQCRSLGKCTLYEDGSIEMQKGGQFDVRFTRMRHSNGQMVKTIVKVMNSKTTTGVVIVSYHIVGGERIIIDENVGRKRISGGSRRLVRGLGEEGRTSRKIMAELAGVKPRQVYHQMKKIEKPRSNRGPVPAIDYTAIMKHLADRENIPFNVSIGNEHDIYLFQSSLMRQNLLESLPDERSLSQSLTRIQRALDSKSEQEINSIHVDVTFSVCEGYFLIIIGVYSSSLRTRSSGKQALIPVCLVLSRKHSKDVFRQIGLYLDMLLSSAGKGELRMRSLMSDKEGSFSGLLEYPFSRSAISLDCHVHLLTNMITAGFKEEEVNKAKKVLFGVQDEFQIGCGGSLNVLDEDEFSKEMSDLSDLSEEMKKWIRKRSSRMWERMSLSGRIRGGIGIRLPSNQALESYNNIVKSQSAPGRRNLNEAFVFILDELKMIDGQIRSAFQGGGLLKVDEMAVSSLPNILAQEKTFIPESIIPVPRGSGRVAFEKRVRKWTTKRIDESPVILENTLGDIVGVSIDDDGRPRCGSSICRMPGRATMCEHIAALVLLGRKDVEECLVRSRDEEPLHNLIHLNVKKGQKPGYRRKVPRRGNNHPPILGMRFQEESIEDEEETEERSERRDDNDEGEDSMEENRVIKRRRDDEEYRMVDPDPFGDERWREASDRSYEVEVPSALQNSTTNGDHSTFIIENTESVDFVSDLRERGRKYNMQKEENAQKELELIRALARSPVYGMEEERMERREYQEEEEAETSYVEYEYLESIDDYVNEEEVGDTESNDRETPVMGQTTLRSEMSTVRVLRDFDAVLEGELSVRVGDEVEVVGEDENWLEGKMRGKRGWFPTNTTLTGARKYTPKRSQKGNELLGESPSQKSEIIGNEHSEVREERSQSLISMRSQSTSYVAEVVLAHDALRLRSRKCGGCAANLTLIMKDKVVLSQTKKRNSKLYHLNCFKYKFPSARMNNPVSISPFVLRQSTQEEINRIQSIFND